MDSPPLGPLPIVLCRLSDLPVNGARGFDLWGQGEETVFVLRLGNGVRVFRNLCPHELRPLGWRRDAFLSADGSRIVCYAHGAQFDINSGSCLHGPSLGQSLQRLSHYVDALGQIVLS